MSIIISKTTVFMALLLVAMIGTVLGSNSTSKSLCYSGSNLYQLLTQDCTSKDSSYTGEWYCAKMEVYESFQPNAREPIITRGCATESECTSSTNAIYSNTEIVSNGLMPGGMKILATCCKANTFPDDDTVAIDYSKICNSGSRYFLPSAAVLAFTSVVAVILGTAL